MRTEVMKAIRTAARPVVVFDVDSTLVSTAARHHGILQAFAEQADHAGLSELVATLGPDDFGWTVDGPLRGRVELDDAAWSALERFWFARFFSGDFLHLDQPVPGAVDFVKRVHRAGAWVYFLTARNAETMGGATLTALHRMGFPLLDGRFTLHLKPHGGVADKVFKRAALQEVAALGEVVATYENEPANANLFAEHFPGATHVWMDSVCSPGAPPLRPEILRIVDFC